MCLLPLFIATLPLQCASCNQHYITSALIQGPLCLQAPNTQRPLQRPYNTTSQLQCVSCQQSTPQHHNHLPHGRQLRKNPASLRRASCLQIYNTQPFQCVTLPKGSATLSQLPSQSTNPPEESTCEDSHGPWRSPTMGLLSSCNLCSLAVSGKIRDLLTNCRQADCSWSRWHSRITVVKAQRGLVTVPATWSCYWCSGQRIGHSPGTVVVSGALSRVKRPKRSPRCLHRNYGIFFNNKNYHNHHHHHHHYQQQEQEQQRQRRQRTT